MPKTKPERIEPAEMDKLMTFVEGEGEEFYVVLLNLMKFTGRRISEYYNVKVKDIDFERGVMRTLVLKRKEKIYREAILNKYCSALLRSYIIHKQLNLEDYVFREKGIRAVQAKLKYYARKIGLNKNLSPHSFRHFFVTQLLLRGWSYNEIAKLTGHSTPQTLMHYDDIVAYDIKDKALADIDTL